jgi:excisionase family DNA binding protein
VRINIDALPDVLTVEEAARFLRISRGLAFAAVRQGDIPSVRVGRRILVPKAPLLAWLATTTRSGAGGTSEPGWMKAEPPEGEGRRNRP